MLFWDHYQMLCNYNKHTEIDQSTIPYNEIYMYSEFY